MLKHMCSFVLLAAGVASAQTEVPAREIVIVNPHSRVDFTGTDVEGIQTRPEGTYDVVRRGAKFESLIRVRSNFAPELQRSVDSL